MMTLVPCRAVVARLSCWFLGGAAALLAMAGPARAAEVVGREREVSLSELLSFAEEHAPATQVASKRRGYADAARAEAAPLFRDNPTFYFSLGPRFDGNGDRDFDAHASLSQPVEIGGQRGLRLEVAARKREQLEAEAGVARYAVRRELVTSYRWAVVARQAVEVSERLVRFSEELLAVVRRRVSAGDATAIDERLAEMELAEARQATVSAAQDLRVARLRLAEVSGWSLETPPMVPREAAAERPVPTLDAAMEVAVQHHPELRARRAATAEARSRAELADREAWPTPVLGVQLSREGSAGSPANYIVLGTLGLALPLWQRNQGERARARVDEAVASAEESAAVRALSGRIARAHAEVAAAAERVKLYTSGVAPSLDDSLARLRRGFEAGELPLSMVSVARERLLRAERQALVAYADYYRALAELEAATGGELGTGAVRRSSGGVR